MFTDDDISKLNPFQKVIEHLQLSDAALTKAAAAEQQHKIAAAKSQQMIPTVLDTLINDTQAIQPAQREKAASLLSTHVGTLELLQKVAVFLTNRAAAGNLGQPVGATKTAAAKQASSDAEDDASIAALITRLNGG